jgi:hypothetical protein
MSTDPTGLSQWETLMTYGLFTYVLWKKNLFMDKLIHTSNVPQTMDDIPLTNGKKITTKISFAYLIQVKSKEIEMKIVS